jgi:hypothetical protein
MRWIARARLHRAHCRSVGILLFSSGFSSSPNFATIPSRSLLPGQRFSESLLIGVSRLPMQGAKQQTSCFYLFLATIFVGDAFSNSAIRSLADEGAGTVPEKICSPETFFPWPSSLLYGRRKKDQQWWWPNSARPDLRASLAKTVASAPLGSVGPGSGAAARTGA